MTWSKQEVTLRLQEIIKQFELDQETLDDYNNPSWAYRQAHINGMNEVLNKLKGLMNV